MVDVWDAVSALIYFPMMFLSTDLLFIKFKYMYYTKDNQPKYSRPSSWSSLWCLGPWMNHLPPVCWSTFRFRFTLFKCQLVCKFGMMERDFSIDFLPLSMSCTLPNYAYYQHITSPIIFIHWHTRFHFDSLVQNCSIQSVLAMKIPESCTKPSICSPSAETALLI